MRNTILIVDDSEDTRDLFRANLEAEGFSVLEASCGPQALEILRKHSNLSMMLLDLSMPEMSGLEMLEAMTLQSLAQKIPVILVSAAKNMDAMKVPQNVVDTLKKPFFYPELIYKIRQVHGLSPKKPTQQLHR